MHFYVKRITSDEFTEKNINGDILKKVWRLMPPDVRESGESPELYLQL
jgi:hypothetical protein